MKMKRLLLGACVMAASTSVLADAAFEGPWVGAGMGFRGTTTEITTPGIDLNGAGKNSIFGTVQGGYGWKLNSDVGDFSVGPYAQYYIGNVTSNTHVLGDPNTGVGLFNANIKWKNQFQVGFQPGYYLGKDTVAYAKVGYSHVSLQLNGANANGQVSNSQSFSGPGAGLGLKTQFAGNWIVFVDAQQVWYSSKNYNIRGVNVDVKPTMSQGTFGIGYQF
jgi:opacity protein-like surface antigen